MAPSSHSLVPTTIKEFATYRRAWEEKSLTLARRGRALRYPERGLQHAGKAPQHPSKHGVAADVSNAPKGPTPWTLQQLISSEGATTDDRARLSLLTPSTSPHCKTF